MPISTVITVVAVGGADTSPLFEDIVQKAGDGDRLASEALVDYFHRDLVSFARRNGSIDPEGAANLVLARSLDKLGGLRNQSEPVVRAYLFTGLRRHLSRERRPCNEILDDSIEERAELEWRAIEGNKTEDQAVEHLALGRLLERLSAHQRFVIVNRYVLDRTYDDIAAELGKSPAAVRQISSRARTTLRLAIVAGALITAWLAVLNAGSSTEDFRLQQEQLNPTDQTEEFDVDLNRTEGYDNEESLDSFEMQVSEEFLTDPPDSSTTAPPAIGEPASTATAPSASTIPAEPASTTTASSTGSMPTPDNLQSTVETLTTTTADVGTVTTGPTVTSDPAPDTPVELSAPVILKPANGATVPDPRVTLAWEGPTGAVSWRLEWEVSKPGTAWTPSRNSPIEIQHQMLTFSSISYPMVRWRVSGIDSEGQVGPASPWHEYTVE